MEENTKRVIKNASYLYIRQLIMMILSFVSTRIVLEKLGIDDYGVYNVVGGFVALFTILNNVLQSSTRRYMALAIGSKSHERIRVTFITSLFLHIMIGVVVVVALETLGVWILNNYLNIAPQRMFAANWVLQFSILTVFISITQTPYTAAVTAHEQFNVYAIMSIYDVCAKIAVLFLLVYLPFDKLITYAALMAIVSFTSCMIYRYYCTKKFPECSRIKFKINRDLTKEMLRFSGWDSVGNITSIANTQCITILLNLFFNTAVNAARGLASTVTSTVAQFVTGFVQAAEPQLVKYFVRNEMQEFNNLIFNVTQMTLFMLAIMAVPIWLEIDYVLKLWLGTVPQYTATFIKITIFICFITYSNTMLLKANVAIGRVREVSLYMIPASLVHLPLVYLVLKLGWNPVSVYWVGSVPALMRLFIDLRILYRSVKFPVSEYLLKIFLKNLLIVVGSALIPFLVKSSLSEGFVRLIIVGFVSVIVTALAMWFFGLNKESKLLIKTAVVNRIPFISKKCL